MNTKAQEQASVFQTTMHMKCWQRSVMQNMYYYQRKREWNKMVDRAMAADFSWSVSAAKYQEMYDWLIG